MYIHPEVPGLKSYLGIESPVALRSGLKSEDQTVIRAVQSERDVWAQASLILHKQRSHTTGVLVNKDTNQTQIDTRENMHTQYIHMSVIHNKLLHVFTA